METTYRREVEVFEFAAGFGADFFGAGICHDMENDAERQRQLEFHIARGDYFSVLQTIFHIAAREKDLDLAKIFSNLEKDMRYLQENYEIKKKQK